MWTQLLRSSHARCETNQEHLGVVSILRCGVEIRLVTIGHKQSSQPTPTDPLLLWCWWVTCTLLQGNMHWASKETKSPHIYFPCGVTLDDPNISDVVRSHTILMEVSSHLFWWPLLDNLTKVFSSLFPSLNLIILLYPYGYPTLHGLGKFISFRFPL